MKAGPFKGTHFTQETTGLPVGVFIGAISRFLLFRRGSVGSRPDPGILVVRRAFYACHRPRGGSRGEPGFALTSTVASLRATTKNSSPARRLRQGLQDRFFRRAVQGRTRSSRMRNVGSMMRGPGDGEARFCPSERFHSLGSPFPAIRIGGKAFDETVDSSRRRLHAAASWLPQGAITQIFHNRFR